MNPDDIIDNYYSDANDPAWSMTGTFTPSDDNPMEDLETKLGQDVFKLVEKAWFNSL
tara:strand:- start:4617 stop:4787 length:171 start_codon:yes stop_codon:yes gene_type:complete